MNTFKIQVIIFITVLVILAIEVGIEKLIERRELKELIEKNSGKNKKENS